MTRIYFGGLEGRRRGGINSWINRRKNPEYYRSLGCNITNTFSYPTLDNPKFAEFIGILLGDGCITKNQLTITLNRVADHHYISYVSSLIKNLFSYTPSIMQRKDSCATVIICSGVDLVSFIEKCGLVRGDKVRQQVGVPLWIQTNLNLAKQCVRGLMDTDGCIFTNRYLSNNKWYQYKKVAFANKSQPLLNFVYTTLTEVGLHPIYYQGKQIRLCSENDTIRYLKIVGSGNERLLRFYS